MCDFDVGHVSVLAIFSCIDLVPTYHGAMIWGYRSWTLQRRVQAYVNQFCGLASLYASFTSCAHVMTLPIACYGG